MSKNIVIFSDGTRQIGGKGSNTNVYKLFNMIEDRVPGQIAYYDPGVGSDRRKILGSISGIGFTRNILDCYRFIFENFEANDRIFLFGFSRGAATVRSLSAFVHHFGVLPKSRPDLIEQAFFIYKNSSKKNLKKNADAFIQKHHTMWCKIEFLGVWDTVAALGLPIKWLSMLLDRLFPYKFHTFDLSESVIFARQALAIDDERKTFHPLLWNTLSNGANKERMKQVWFAGVHTDVGGGYAEDALSNISLLWMMREATDKGLRIYTKSPAYQSLMSEKPNANGIMHNEQKSFPGKYFKRVQRNWNTQTHGEPCIHVSVFERTQNADNTSEPAYSPWIVNCINKANPCIEPW